MRTPTEVSLCQTSPHPGRSLSAVCDLRACGSSSATTSAQVPLTTQVERKYFRSTVLGAGVQRFTESLPSGAEPQHLVAGSRREVQLRNWFRNDFRADVRLAVS